jgi:hypothetical protein
VHADKQQVQICQKVSPKSHTAEPLIM